MKTQEIQAAITLAKQLAREWRETGTLDDFANFARSLDNIVKVTVETIPPKVEVMEVEVVREKLVIQEKPVEVVKHVEVIREVAVPTTVVQEVAIPPTSLFE